MAQHIEPREEQILNRAYKIWEDNGKPEGREEEFWQRAQEELRREAREADSVQ
jgi:hypothetical protein